MVVDARNPLFYRCPDLEVQTVASLIFGLSGQILWCKFMPLSQYFEYHVYCQEIIW